MIDYELAVQSVCETVGMLGIEASPDGSIESCDSFQVENDVIVIIGFIGSRKYNAAFSMSKQTAQAIAGMMVGAQSCEMDEIGRSAIGELVNMICGNIASAFPADHLDITLPTVIAGEDIACAMQSFESTRFALHTLCGSFEVNIALEG